MSSPDVVRPPICPVRQDVRAPRTRPAAPASRVVRRELCAPTPADRSTASGLAANRLGFPGWLHQTHLTGGVLAMLAPNQLLLVEPSTGGVPVKRRINLGSAGALHRGAGLLRFPWCRRWGPALSQPAGIGAGTRPWAASTVRTGWIAGISTPSLRHGAADYGHSRRNVFAQTRHYGFAPNRKPPLPPTLLLPSPCLASDADLTSPDRLHHRTRPPEQRRASPLARPRPLPRSAASRWVPVRRCRRCGRRAGGAGGRCRAA